MTTGFFNVRRLGGLLVAGLLLGGSVGAYAEYPERPVKVIQPFAAGGSGDNIQRLFAQKLSERTGKPFVVENKTGAGGRIAFEAAAKSPGDGYTLVAGDPTYTVLPGLHAKLPWDPVTDLIPVTMYARAPFAVVVSAQSRFKTLRELLDFARANPGKVTYGTPGSGTIGHVVFETLLREAKVTMTSVPYRGGSEALAAVMGNTIDVMVTGGPTIMSQLKGGKINVLAMTSQERWPGAEAVPTVAEVVPKFVSYLWFGLMAPKGTPPAVVDYLHQQVVAILQDPSTKEALQVQGVQGAVMPPAELGRLIRDDTKRWTDVIRAAKISAE